MLIRGMYTWNGEYKEVEFELQDIVKRNPHYNDTYSVLFDLYWGSDQDYKSFSIYNKALKNKVGDVNFSFKLAKAYLRMHIVDDVSNILNSILIENPKNKEFIKFK